VGVAEHVLELALFDVNADAKREAEPVCKVV
jgi:hypothetical protein